MSTGFVRGFDVGFNAVNSALRLAEMKRDADHRRKREDEKWGYEKDELDRKRTLAADLAAAGEEPTSGLVVGEAGARNFADSPEEQSFLREQDASIAELEGRRPSVAKIAVGSGRNILDPSDPRAQSGRRGYASRVADAYRKAGEADKAFSVEDIQREFERTRLKDAARHLFVSNGDAAGTQRLWEEANGPLGGTLIAEPTKRVGADGVEIPDYNLAIRDEQGNVEPMGSAFTMLYMAENPAEYLKFVRTEHSDAAKAKRDDARLALDERRVSVLEQNANTMEAYRRDQRAAGGGQGAPQFNAPSMSDQKAIREAVMTTLQDGQDESVATDLATRLVMANPTLTAAQAARLATTPGVQVRNVTTNAGVMPALVTPDGQAVLLAPGPSSWQAPPQATPKPEPSATAQAVDKFIDKTKAIGAALVTPRDRAAEEREAASKPSPAQIAAQPKKREAPPRQESTNAVKALRAESRRLLARAEKSTDPDEKATLRRQAESLEAQARRQERAGGGW